MARTKEHTSNDGAAAAAPQPNAGPQPWKAPHPGTAPQPEQPPQGESFASPATPAPHPLPTWMRTSEHYQPQRDHDAFLTKSILSVLGVLARFQLQNGRAGAFEPAALCKLFILVAVILMTSLASNFFFVLIVLALVLLRTCLLPSNALKETLATALLAALLTCAIMLPAVLLGQTHSFIVLPTKVFISVALALIVSTTTPFNQLTASLRTLHIPNLLILTLDLTLKYIVMLGDIALETLQALRCRSVGKNARKGQSLGGVIGSTFIRSQELSLETYDAMVCRGFTGEYGNAKQLTADRTTVGTNNPPATQTAPRLQVVSTLLSLVGTGALFALFLMLEGFIAW